MKLQNANGVTHEYGEVQDLWHLAMAVREGRDFSQFEPEMRELWCDQILEVWYLAHDLKDAFEGNGKAKLIEY